MRKQNRIRYLNCWELTECGREPGGCRVAELGVCRAASDASSDGINRGKNGGRICWAITGTLCGGKIRGDCTEKQASCMVCKVFRRIKAEEGTGFVSMKPWQAYMTVD